MCALGGYKKVSETYQMHLFFRPLYYLLSISNKTTLAKAATPDIFRPERAMSRVSAFTTPNYMYYYTMMINNEP